MLALAPTWLGAGRFSRHALRRAVGPDPVTAPEDYAARVDALAEEQGPLVVYSGQEASLDALLAASEERPERLILPYATPSALERVRDKRLLAEYCTWVGLKYPKTLFSGTASELLAGEVAPPFMLKPAQAGGSLTRVLPIATTGELHRQLTSIPLDEPLLVQERLSGPLTAVALVLDETGSVLARFQQVARRTWPPGAGPSSFAVSVPPDEDLISRSARLLAEVGYSGLAQLQFVGPRGAQALIDVNTRFYGSLPLALSAGVNLPAVWHASVTGLPIPPLAPYRVGVSYRALRADIAAALHGMPRLLFERGRKPRVGSMWARDDPLASVVLAASVAGRRLRRTVRAQHGRHDGAPPKSRPGSRPWR